MITANIYSIFTEEDRFLSLQEVYLIYKEKYNISEFKDYKAVIRRHIYSQCLDRDIRSNNKEPLFYSLAPKKTKGNLYGIVKWLSEDNKDIVVDDINKLMNRISTNPVFDEVPIVKYKEIKSYTSMKTKSRRVKYAIQAIVKANYLCEYNYNHESFIRKSNDKKYTEAHHLIPLKFQDDFEYSLDVPANIISLCSNCHNEIHYGKNKEELIKSLYYKRKKELEKYKIFCSYDQLCKYYEID